MAGSLLNVGRSVAFLSWVANKNTDISKLDGATWSDTPGPVEPIGFRHHDELNCGVMSVCDIFFIHLFLLLFLQVSEFDCVARGSLIRTK
jgi:hypothetical protein